ncbi:MAG: cell wall metabolism sensor histidine kinase WalK [Clostridiales bacterium]|nr:cell wall metabolism sensor histidine kinase WalK [Clostridiales bacterium]
MVTISIKKPRFYSIRWKLMIIFLVITIVPLVFHFSTIMTSIKTYFQEDRESQLLDAANILAGYISKNNYFEKMDDSTRWQLMDSEIYEKSKEGGFRVLVFDNRLYCVNDTNYMHAGKTISVPEVVHALTKGNTVRTYQERKTTYASASIVNSNSDVVGAVLLVSSVDDIFMSVAEIQSRLIMYTALTSVIMGFLVLVFSQFLIDPLKNVLSVVQKMSEGHLEQRIHLTSHDEYAKLGRAFNEMAEKLEKVDRTRAEFVSNVSHELKTPLSSMKVLSESILFQDDVPVEYYREFLQDINSEVDRLTSIVKDLLQLVKLDQREIEMNVQMVSLNKMISEIVKRLAPLAEQNGIELACDVTREVYAEVDESKMASAISNLVDNAIKYTPDKGKVKVGLDADHQNAFVTVQDTGIGISEEDQSKVFDRFYRVDKTRDRETGGTGLGLSITHATMLLHNGSIKLTSKENEGSSFVLRIPIHHSGT